jgi:hypothetical protein
MVFEKIDALVCEPTSDECETNADGDEGHETLTVCGEQSIGVDRQVESTEEEANANS